MKMKPLQLCAVVIHLVLKTAKSAMPFDLPEDLGNIVKLRDEQFMNGFPMKDLNKEWFIMYYSPTCPICKGVIPLLVETSRGEALRDRRNAKRVMKIGIVDCNKHRFACARADGGITHFPHMAHTVDGGRTWGRFMGDSTVEGLSFAIHRAMNPAQHITPLKNYPALEAATAFSPARENSGIKVVLVANDPDGEEIRAFRAMVGLAGSFAAVRFFVFVRPKSSPKMTVYNDAAPKVWPGPAPEEARNSDQTKAFRRKYGASHTFWDAKDMVEWLLPNRHLAVEKFEQSNLHELSHVEGKYTALVVHDDSIEAEANFLMNGLREVATHGKGRFMANFTFGCLAAKGYTEWLEKHRISKTEFPLFVVANAPWGTFFRNATVEESIRQATHSRWSARFVADVVEYLDNINSGHEKEQGSYFTFALIWFYKLPQIVQLFVGMVACIGVLMFLILCLCVGHSADEPKWKKEQAMRHLEKVVEAKRGIIPKASSTKED